MAVIALDEKGEYLSGEIGVNDFCAKYTRSSEEGAKRCQKCDQEGCDVYLCHAGLMDFSKDIVVDGKVFGKIVGGQILPQEPDEDKFRAIAEELGIDLFHPVKYEGRELEKRLKELAELSDNYRRLFQNRASLSEDLLSAACNNPEILPFALSLLEDNRTETPKLQPISLSEEEKKSEGIPLLLQFDERWGACGYGESMIAVSGCAPTCLSMVIIGLTGDTDATPNAVASYADEKGYYLNGIGTDWSFLTEGARHFGLSAKEVALDEDMVLRELEQGHPIICSMRKGTFTAQGHFIVLAGGKDGKILVRDPNSRAKSEMLWDFSEIRSQIRNLWRYVV